jgi:hypothetical protein
MRAKAYTSEAWLRRQYVTNGKSIDDICAECGVSYNTIRVQLIKFNLLRK